VSKNEEVDDAQAFIDLQERIGLGAILDYASTACEVAAEGAADELLARAWRRLSPELGKVANRARELDDRTLARRRWEEASPDSRIQGDFIGTETTYLGGEWPARRAACMRIEAVLRHVEGQGEMLKIRTNEELRAAGGVSARDRVEVREVKAGGQLSFVTADPYALDLACFATLRSPQAKSA
jgi:hypothetical protein